MDNNSTNINKKKLTTTSHLKSLNTKWTMTNIYTDGNPGPGIGKDRCIHMMGLKQLLASELLEISLWANEVTGIYY